MRRMLVGVVALIATQMIVGCGGGSGGGSTPVQTRSVTPALTINWASRSRSISAPASALSASITVTGVSGSSVSFNEDRPSGTAALAQTYSAPASITVQDTTTVQVTFYAQPGGAGGSGAVVAGATASVPIQDDGTLATTITNVQSAIASVTVTPNQSVKTGLQAYLSYSVTNTSGQVVALSPGSAFFTVASGSADLAVTGEVGTGLAGGTATVTATVDGVTSAPVAVTVIAPVKIALVANGASPQVVSFLQQLQAKNIQPVRMDAVPDAATLQAYDVLMIWSGNGTGGNLSSADAAKALAFLSSGRGVVLLGSAPVQLAGTTTGDNAGDLSSIAAWFGGVRSMTFPTFAINSNDDVYARGTSGDFALPAIVSPNSLVYPYTSNDYRPVIFAADILNPATDKVLGNTSSGEVDAIAYTPVGGGRVYWQFSPTGLNPTYTANVLAVLIAGTDWAAGH